MTPYAKYTFMDSGGFGYPQIRLYKHTGVDIPDFPSEIRKPGWMYRRSSKRFDLPKKRFYIRLLGFSPPMHLSYIPEMRNFYYGHYNDDAVLVKCEWESHNDISRIDFWLFRGMRQEAEMLYNQWISYQLILD
jgi:hypothetical protein